MDTVQINIEYYLSLGLINNAFFRFNTQGIQRKLINVLQSQCWSNDIQTRFACKFRSVRVLYG